jgi:predicted O-methyltransferase YrrM
MYEDRVKFLAIREELRQMVQSQFPEKDLQREIWIGSIKPFDAHYFARVLRKYKPATILEVGSYIGLSSRWILEVTRPWKSRITCVDPNIPHWSFQDPRQIRMQFLQKFAAENRVKNITGSIPRLEKVSTMK